MENQYCALGVLSALADKPNTKGYLSSRVEYMVQWNTGAGIWIAALPERFRDKKAAKASKKIFRQSRPWIKKCDTRIVEITETRRVL